MRYMANSLRRIIWFVGVPLAAAAGGLVGFLPVVVMGLVVPVFLVGPLGLATGALLATLLAGWIANFAAFSDKAGCRERSRLLMVFLVSLLGAVAGLLVSMVITIIIDSLGAMNVMSVLLFYLPSIIVFTAATTVATWRFRNPVEGETSLGFVGAATLGLSSAWVLFLFLYEWFGPQLGGLLPSNLGLFLPLWFIAMLGLLLAASGTAVYVVFTRNKIIQDAGLTLILTGLTPTLIIGTIATGCTLAYCGA